MVLRAATADEMVAALAAHPGTAAHRAVPSYGDEDYASVRYLTHQGRLLGAVYLLSRTSGDLAFALTPEALPCRD